MKRHPSLAPLSREHHAALILSRLLQKNAPHYKTLPADTEGKAGYAVKFYHDHLIRHFKEEEKVLELVKGMNASLDLLLPAIFAEHNELRQHFESINIAVDLPSLLHQLGKDLEKHIRKEERELFPLMESCCDDNMMAAIERSLSS